MFSLHRLYRVVLILSTLLFLNACGEESDSGASSTLSTPTCNDLKISTYNYYKKIGDKPSIDKLELLNIDANAENADCVSAAGMLLYHGYSDQKIEADKEKAYALFEYAASSEGEAMAQYYLGEFYYLGSYVTQDYDQAFKWYSLSANQDLTSAQYNVGYSYSKGLGISQNYELAAHWYSLAAEKGHDQAQHNLGLLYDNGTGVSQDYETALHWYTLAANQGLASSQTNIGILHYYGNGVTQDYEEALKWFLLADEQDNVTAQSYIGRIYYYGYGVTKDYVEAAKWFNWASFAGENNDDNSKGSAFAQYALGFMYYNGQGIEKNTQIGVAMLKFAANNGSQSAKDYLKSIGE